MSKFKVQRKDGSEFEFKSELSGPGFILNNFGMIRKNFNKITPADDESWYLLNLEYKNGNGYIKRLVKLKILEL